MNNYENRLRIREQVIEKTTSQFVSANLSEILPVSGEYTS